MKMIPYDNCPTCNLCWQLFPPAKIDYNIDAVQCVECKAVYPTISQYRVGIKNNNTVELVVENFRRYVEKLEAVKTLPKPYDLYYAVKNIGQGTGWTYRCAGIGVTDLRLILDMLTSKPTDTVATVAVKPFDKLIHQLEYWGNPKQRLQNDHAPIKKVMREAAQALTNQPVSADSNASAEARWKKKFKGRPSGGAWIHTHSSIDRAIVENHHGFMFNGVVYASLNEAKEAALSTHPNASDCARNDWDGLDCGCGGGWKVGHRAGCPEADSESE